LERWLSDHNVAYPTPADRKDLETLVKDNWNTNVVEPYNSWDTKQLQSYLTLKGKQATKGTENNKQKLAEQVKSSWTETADSADSAYENVRDWILDSWTESQLKAFLDKHGIPNPQPRTRDTLLTTARENYASIAQKAGETAAYPGDWLYSTWSESDLKAWCDERGIPVPQPSSRDKIIASVRRNSRIASSNLAAYSASIASSAAAATSGLSDALLNSWSDSQIKEWADKNGIKVPQGSKRNELLALARKHRAKLTGDNVSYKASSAYGAATTSAGNQYAYATSVAYDYYTWLQHQIGLGASSASSSGVSATSVVGKSASSASSVASKSALSASSVASKSAASVLASISSEASSASSSASKVAATKGSKQAQKAGDAAAESVSKAKHRALESAQKATHYVKEEL